MHVQKLESIQKISSVYRSIRMLDCSRYFLCLRQTAIEYFSSFTEYNTDELSSPSILKFDGVRLVRICVSLNRLQRFHFSAG